MSLDPADGVSPVLPHWWTQVQSDLLEAYIIEAISQQRPHVRRVLERIAVDGRLVVTPVVRKTDRGLDALVRVEFPVADGGLDLLCDVHWTRLELDAHQLTSLVSEAAYLNGLAIPDDLSTLNDS